MRIEHSIKTNSGYSIALAFQVNIWGTAAATTFPFSLRSLSSLWLAFGFNMPQICLGILPAWFGLKGVVVHIMIGKIARNVFLLSANPILGDSDSNTMG